MNDEIKIFKSKTELSPLPLGKMKMGNNQNWPYKEERKGLASPNSSLELGNGNIFDVFFMGNQKI